MAVFLWFIRRFMYHSYFLVITSDSMNELYCFLCGMMCAKSFMYLEAPYAILITLKGLNSCCDKRTISFFVYDFIGKILIAQALIIDCVMSFESEFFCNNCVSIILVNEIVLSNDNFLILGNKNTFTRPRMEMLVVLM